MPGTFQHLATRVLGLAAVTALSISPVFAADPVRVSS